MALLAGFAGGALDKLWVFMIASSSEVSSWLTRIFARVETKGLDYLDKQKAKKHAEDQVKEYYETEH